MENGLQPSSSAQRARAILVLHDTTECKRPLSAALTGTPGRRFSYCAGPRESARGSDHDFTCSEADS
jgi:hypothetical protein